MSLKEITEETLEYLAAVIFYKPSREQILRVIELAQIVQTVCIVLNGPTDHPHLIYKLNEVKNIKIIENFNNDGIARAINQAIDVFLGDSNCDLLILLDQDTIVTKDALNAALEIYAYQQNFPGTDFILACSLSDVKAQRSRGVVIEPAEISQRIRSVSSCETSGTILDRKVLRSVGRMNEALFIDGVDHEWCLRAKNNHVTIWRILSPHLTHSIGETGVNILGRYFPLHTSPARHYYIIRNSFYIFYNCHGSILRRLNILASAILRVPFYLYVSADRTKTAFHIWQGLRDGFAKKLGPHG
jgi:rhamnosyltransferase